MCTCAHKQTVVVETPTLTPTLTHPPTPAPLVSNCCLVCFVIIDTRSLKSQQETQLHTTAKKERKRNNMNSAAAQSTVACEYCARFYCIQPDRSSKSDAHLSPSASRACRRLGIDRRHMRSPWVEGQGVACDRAVSSPITVGGHQETLGSPDRQEIFNKSECSPPFAVSELLLTR